jgi:hypothetical protein
MAKSASGGTMIPRLSSLLILSALLCPVAQAKDKKPAFTEDVLRAQTVRVMVDPDAGEPLDQPSSNAMARENVERAMMEWGRFRLVMDGEPSDLIIAIRTGSGRMVRPTIKGGPIDRRPGVGQSTDSSIRIGGQHGQPPMTDPTMDPQNQRPRMGNEIGPSQDMFTVYRGDTSSPLDSPPVWRYMRQDCLRPTPEVPAVEEFRKALAAAEKAKAANKP